MSVDNIKLHLEIFKKYFRFIYDTMMSILIFKLQKIISFQDAFGLSSLFINYAS